MTAILIILFFTLLISHIRLYTRVRLLELDLETPGQDVVKKPASDEALWKSERMISSRKPRNARSGPGPLMRLWTWLSRNWALAVAGLSLALSGVFLVQYGVEQGLLTPAARIIAALTLGAGFIGSGEWLRRRYGDEGKDAGAVAGLPSILSGSGVIVLFAAVLAASGLYGLIGPGMALASLFGIGLLAILLGWFHGPVLTGFGLVGATLAPFLVGGSSESAWILQYYFALITAIGLAVDRARQWRWISILALISGGAGATLLQFSIHDLPHYLGFWGLAVLAAVILPGFARPDLRSGPSVTRWAITRQRRPDLPGWLAFATVLAATGAAALLGSDADTMTSFWLAAAFLVMLILALSIGTEANRAHQDLPVLPALGFIALLGFEALAYGPLFQAFLASAVVVDLEPVARPLNGLSVTMNILLIGAAIALLFSGRLRRASDYLSAIFWAFAIAISGAGVVLIQAFLWQPADVIEPYTWAWHAMFMATLMTGLALRVCGQAAHICRAILASAAIVMITLSLFTILSDAALTLALAIMVFNTILIMRYFKLPLGALVQIGIALIGYHLIIDPGVAGAVFHSTYADVLLAHLGTLLVLAAAWWLTPDAEGRPSRVVLESAIWLILAIFVSVMIQKWLGLVKAGSHAGLGLTASVWVSMMMVQLYRLKAPGRVSRWVRWILAGISGIIALGAMAAQAIIANPILPIGYSFLRKDIVTGPPVLSSLMAGYLILALVFAAGAWRLTHVNRWLRGIFICLAGAYGATWVALEIRRAWRGPDLSLPGVLDGELYSYTLAMILASVILLGLALMRRSEVLRKIAMAGVALIVAKVFMIDMDGLAGLLRVASFLGLGLALVGLGWINARIAIRMKGETS